MGEFATLAFVKRPAVARRPAKRSDAIQEPAKQERRTKAAATARSERSTFPAFLGSRLESPPQRKEPAPLSKRAEQDGAPLDPALRRRMEGDLGVDLSAVRVHAGPGRRADRMRTRAFAYGDDIYLGRNESPTDRRLLAHEVTHVLQQRAAGRSVVQHWEPGLLLTDPSERQADQFGDAFSPFVTETPLALVVEYRFGPLATYWALYRSLPAEHATRLENAVRRRQAMIDGEAYDGSPYETSVSAPLSGFLPPDISFTPRAEVLGTYLSSLGTVQGLSDSAGEAARRIARNEALRTYLAGLMTRQVEVVLVDPDGATGQPFTLEFLVDGVPVTDQHGMLPVENLDPVATEPLARVADRVGQDVEQLALVSIARARGRAGIREANSLGERVSSAPGGVAQMELTSLHDGLDVFHRDVTQLRSQLRPANADQQAELDQIAVDVAAARDRTARDQRTLWIWQGPSIPDRTAGEEWDELISEQEQLMVNNWRIGGGYVAYIPLNAVFWTTDQIYVFCGNFMTAGTMTPVGRNARSYRNGWISYDDYISNSWSIVALAGINLIVTYLTAGLGSGLVSRLVGTEVAMLATTTRGMMAAGAGEGLVMGTTTAFGSDIYNWIVSRAADSPGVRGFHEQAIVGPAGWMSAGTQGMIFGGGMGGLASPTLFYRPRTGGGFEVVERPPEGAPIRLYGPRGEPMLVQDGVIVEPDRSGPRVLFGPDERPIIINEGELVNVGPERPVGLFDAAGRRIQVQGGEIVATDTGQPVVVFDGTGTPVINAHEPAGSLTTLLGDPRVISPLGPQPASGRLGAPPLELPPGATLEPGMGGGGGRLILDLQAGGPDFLRAETAARAGSTGIGYEPGSWLLAYQDIYPMNAADLALSRQIAQRSPIWPDTPAWRTPISDMPGLFPWEIDPHGYIFPRGTTVSIVPEPFFPAYGPESSPFIPRGPRDVQGVRPTMHPELHGRADIIYLRRPFGLGRADAATNVLLGRELNAQLRPGGYVEIRATRATDFNVAGGQHTAVAAEIQGARVHQVGEAAIRRFRQNGEMPANAGPIEQEMIRGAAEDTVGLGEGGYRWVVRIYRGQ